QAGERPDAHPDLWAAPGAPARRPRPTPPPGERRYGRRRGLPCTGTTAAWTGRCAADAPPGSPQPPVNLGDHLIEPLDRLDRPASRPLQPLRRLARAVKL